MANIRVLPHNDEVEQNILGAILIDKDAIVSVSEILSPPDFYNEVNGIIYEAMLVLYEERKPIDLLTLAEVFKKKKQLKRVDSAYLTDLVDKVLTAANVEAYAKIVKEDATKRNLIHAGIEVAELGYAEDKQVKEILDLAESSIFSISQSHIKGGFVQLKTTLTESFDRIDELQKQGAGFRGVRTGFLDLDNLLSGMQKTNLLILAARPGQGKTALVLNIAQHIALKEKKPVGIFSLEMSKEELVDRLLIAQSDVDAWRLKTGKLSEEDFTKLSQAMGELAEAPLFIDDTPGLSILEMRSKARRLQMEHDLGLIVVDYLQLVDPGRRYDNRVQEVSMVSQALKNLARELNVPVLAASQLSRAVEHRGEKRPQLADLRESGAIEQDADVVMFIYRPDIEVTTPHIPSKLLIAKHRNGPTGEIDLMFFGNRIRFSSVEKSRQV
ncbi:replicative DNA helicase [Patescibacteria group bacterium]|nr:replicative DNA helicase [Patescibacteria group bacterium]MBU4098153.1 replicative DNA helicase [Patescibacteria group bacterium]